VGVWFPTPPLSTPPPPFPPPHTHVQISVALPPFQVPFGATRAHSRETELFSGNIGLFPPAVLPVVPADIPIHSHGHTLQHTVQHTATHPTTLQHTALLPASNFIPATTRDASRSASGGHSLSTVTPGLGRSHSVAHIPAAHNSRSGGNARARGYGSARAEDEVEWCI